MIDEKVLSLSLSEEEIADRIQKGLVNYNADTKSKSVKRIIFDNTITLFNGINLFLMLLLIMVGSFKHMLYMFVVAGNTIIGIVQEIRSKKAVDKLSIVAKSSIKAVRSGEITEIASEDIVLDDVIILNTGMQIPCDCVIVSGFCYANESLLTGESDLIEKCEGDKLFSGSFVASGEVCVKVTSVGADNYAAKIQLEAKAGKKVNSEIMRTLNKIITYIAITIFPVGIALFVNQFFFNGGDLKSVITTVVAALIGMIPQGLILLTSTVLAVAVIRLSLKKVLVQQLFCIETLARVDVLCLDKTGTITSGDLEVVEIIPLDFDKLEAEMILKSLACNSLDKNSTVKAIDEYINCDYQRALEVIPFVSEKKWSGAVLEDNNSYVLGAAEFIYDNSFSELFDKIKSIDNVYRVVALGKS
ncbi:MAG: HAD-IC family P-type ATPase, partial [Ruminococcus sp.]|nr:HAD-IC family P-type ATPase [Ruminococcus sp.]